MGGDGRSEIHETRVILIPREVVIRMIDPTSFEIESCEIDPRRVIDEEHVLRIGIICSHDRPPRIRGKDIVHMEDERVIARNGYREVVCGVAEFFHTHVQGIIVGYVGGIGGIYHHVGDILPSNPVHAADTSRK